MSGFVQLVQICFTVLHQQGNAVKLKCTCCIQKMFKMIDVNVLTKIINVPESVQYKAMLALNPQKVIDHLGEAETKY